MSARLQMRMMMRVGVIAGSMLGATSLGAEEAKPAKPATEGPQTAAIQDGATVQIDYTLTVDGQAVDSSEGRGPMSYIQGRGQIIPGLERQLVGLHVGDERELTVTPEEGYGVLDPKALVEVPKDQLPTDMTPKVGMMLRGVSPNGQSFRAEISEIGDSNVTLDLNHPLAGKTLHFTVKVVEIAPAQQPPNSPPSTAVHP